MWIPFADWLATALNLVAEPELFELQPARAKAATVTAAAAFRKRETFTIFLSYFFGFAGGCSR
jgi:hypothetical protein